MKHNRYKEMIYLYGMDELTLSEKREFEKHIQECEECREEFLAVKSLQSALIDNKPPEPAEETIYGARNKLYEEIRELENRKSIKEIFSEFFGGALFGGERRVVFTGAFSLVVGVIIGLSALLFSNESGVSPEGNIIDEIRNNNFRISNVRFPKNKEAGDIIEISFDAVRPVKYDGNINDDFTRQLLAASLSNADNPGVKLKTINTIRDNPAYKTLEDTQVKKALITALKTDENPGVRREAMDLLSDYVFDEEIKEALIFALSNDPNSGIRVAAINALAKKESPEDQLDKKLKELLENMEQTEENNFIRLRAASILKEVE